MNNNTLLIFHAGGQEYGVPVAAVSAVIGTARRQGPSQQPSWLAGTLGGSRGQPGQAAILLHSGGLQLILSVDKIIKVMDQAVAGPPAAGAFRIYRFPAAAGLQPGEAVPADAVASHTDFRQSEIKRRRRTSHEKHTD